MKRYQTLRNTRLILSVSVTISRASLSSSAALRCSVYQPDQPVTSGPGGFNAGISRSLTGASTGAALPEPVAVARPFATADVLAAVAGVALRPGTTGLMM